MFCPNCGKKIADNSRFCEFCGAAVLLPEMGQAVFDAEAEYDERSETGTQDANYPGEESENAWAKTGGVNPYMPESEPAESDAAVVSDSGGNDAKNRKCRMIIILIVIAAAAAVVVIAFAMFKFSEKKQQEEWQEQYDLGEQALLDEDYDQAVVNFTEAIEIDPEEPDAYIGRGDAYAGQGKTDEALADYEQARDILEEDLKENPDDEEIADKMDDIADKIGYIDDLIKEKENLNRYQAYYDKLMELQEIYGEAELCSVEYEFSETYSYTICRWEGLYYAMLLDFDGDGQEELLTALYDPDADDQDEEQDGQVIQVWSYEDGEVQELYRQDLLIMGERYYYGCVVEIHEDNCYILDGYYGGDGSYEWYYEEYYTLESGSFCMAKSFDKYGMTAGCQVDGEDVSSEKLSEARDAWAEDLTEKLTYVFLWEDGYENGDEMKNTAALQETLSELAQILGIEMEEEESGLTNEETFAETVGGENVL